MSKNPKGSPLLQFSGLTLFKNLNFEIFSDFNVSKGSPVQFFFEILEFHKAQRVPLFNISALAGIILKSENAYLFFFQNNFSDDLNNSDILFGSECKREI